MKTQETMCSINGIPLSQLLSGLSAAERDDVENFFMDYGFGDELSVEINEELIGKIRRYLYLGDGGARFCAALENALASAAADCCRPSIDLERLEDSGEDF